MPDPAPLLAAADQLEEQAAELEKAASRNRERAAQLRQIAGEMIESIESSLTLGPIRDGIKDDMETAVPQKHHRTGPRYKVRLAFVVALEVNKSSIAEWAEKKGLSANTVRGWASGRKKPPHGWAKTIAREFPGVPATVESWPQGIQKP